MIITDRDMLTIAADYHVVPVNLQPGVMGAGVARIFRDLFPGLPAWHGAACRRGALAIGQVRVVNTILVRQEFVHARLIAPPRPVPPTVQNIVLFPTKDDWRKPSKLNWIKEGLCSFSDWLHNSPTELTKFRQGLPTTIVMPALGCGLGGLDFEQVTDEIKSWQRNHLYDSVKIYVCLPGALH